MTSHNVATLIFPSSSLAAYFKGTSKMEFLFTDSRFSNRKVIEHIFFDLDNKLRNSGMKLDFEKRNTLSGTGWTVMLSKTTEEKIKLSNIWPIQIVHAILAKLVELGYVLNHSTDGPALASQVFYFKEAIQVEFENFFV